VAHERSVSLAKSELLDFCGKNDEKIRQLEKTLGTKLILRGTDIKIVGEQPKVEHAVQVIGELLQAQRQSGKLSPQQFRQGLARARRFDEDARDTAAGRPVDDPPTESLGDLFGSGIPVPLRNRQLTPLTAGQKKYVEAMSSHDITFGIGPAGTGKTYLAVAMALAALREGKVSRIILTRPAVEAGEKRWDFCPVTFTKDHAVSAAACMMRCRTCCRRMKSRSTRNGTRSRSRRWRTCEGAR
jgi:phosphate starvation-inducible PhoH-like protein